MPNIPTTYVIFLECTLHFTGVAFYINKEQITILSATTFLARLPAHLTLSQPIGSYVTLLLFFWFSIVQDEQIKWEGTISNLLVITLFLKKLAKQVSKRSPRLCSPCYSSREHNEFSAAESLSNPNHTDPPARGLEILIIFLINKISWYECISFLMSNNFALLANFINTFSRGLFNSLFTYGSLKSVLL